MQLRPVHAWGNFRAPAAALSVLSLITGTTLAPNVAAQTAPAAYASDTATLAKGDTRLAAALAFHQNTRLGAPDVSTLRALDAWICMAAPSTLPGVLSSFTTRRLCADEDARGANVRYRLGVNQTELDDNIAAITREFSPRGISDVERGLVRLQAERILLSLYFSNESATAIQLNAGVNRIQNSTLASSRSDYAAISIATEIASDARMLAQASSLIHEEGMREDLVIRALNAVFPASEGGELLRIYDQGRGTAGYNPTVTMTQAMNRLWNVNSSNETVRGRTRIYLDRAYPSGRPDILTAPLGRNAMRAVRLTAPSSGLPNFEDSLLSMAVATSQSPQLVNYRPLDTGLFPTRAVARRL